jgi:3,4-dihydroxy 2-butanone 4-phosphate synthase / GTP cyclohydrolase II
VRDVVRADTAFASVEEAIAQLRSGRMIIITDDEDRENEGDLMIAAEKITPEAINFMATYGRGLICLPMTGEHLDRLQVPLMVADPANTSPHGTAFCVSIEARQNVSTGISASDRAQTVRTAIDSATRPEDLVRPGHVFPLRAREGGVLVRAGQTEASVDLARIAGLHPSAVICEVMREDGTMARTPDLLKFAADRDLRIITVADVIAYRLRTETFVRKMAETILPTSHGEFRMIGFESLVDGENHVALVRGDIGDGQDVLVRVHSHCLTGDVFGSTRCHCRKDIDLALAQIAAEGRGVLLYLHQSGRGFALARSSSGIQLEYHGKHDIALNESIGLKGEQREYGIGIQILRALEIRSMRILTNHPRKLVALEGYGLDVLAQVPLGDPAP